MNNPFYYTPSPECLKAVKEVTDWLYGKPSPFCAHAVDPAFRAEIDKGKMFGVLIVEDCNNNSQRYLAAYSGQVCGRSDWEEFVPAVFDYLEPEGYFKRHEAEIVEINRTIQASSLAPQPNSNHKAQCSMLNAQSNKAQCSMLNAQSNKPQFDKKQREGESKEDYIKRRQFENAELHRWKLRERARREEAEAVVRQKEDKIKQLKTLRKQKSDSLQRWLFSHFVMMNGKGNEKNLLEIDSPAIPPAGSGECCEPKLLQYAFTHGLKPVSMAMFWWGASPKNEVRHHLHFYPACNSKCKPILKWMLQGIDVDPNPLESKERDAKLASQIKTIYEDTDICVISKPAGLLSVPGKSGRESILSIMRRRYPNADSPLIVHRLDMDTSGLMIIAKTMTAYHNLQKQFAEHGVKKRYVAVLSQPVQSNGLHNIETDDSLNNRETDSGCISLPLRPDLEDRPRQVVDFEYGKPAVTYYKIVGEQRIWLSPQTGRTHQLRVHCAHRLGLDNPIKGDRLYGCQADRLYLHAEEITFTHPTLGKRMTFTDKAPF